MNNSELEQLCQYWQKQLGIQDWDITVKFGIPQGNNIASTTTYLNYMEAIITIMNDEDYKKLHTTPMGERQPIESDLIHELLEVMFDVIRREHDQDSKDYRWEQCFNKLAKSLNNLSNYKGNNNES